MTDETVDETLREMAQHRGLKLVKSRRRKPGVGDFGKFGLTDASGNALLGISDSGLTADASDIENYLRTGAISTWRQSADTTPDRAPPKHPQPDEVRAKDPPVSRRNQLPARTQPQEPHRVRPRTAKKTAPTVARRADDQSNWTAKPAKIPKNSQPHPQPQPQPQPQPILLLRPAETGDAAAIAQLLAQLSGITTDQDSIDRNVEALRYAAGEMLVAEKGALVGCCAWTVVPTVHRGPVGRVSVLIVDGAHRRQGIGTQLLQAAEEALEKVGCSLVEAMSDIDIKHAHNFFRARKFQQASYRFVRRIDD
ncbi:GNAT family N-acetyltransferase [Sphingomonas sp. LaA6.9]|uniref:GNAT family N-acetyltransferase n=1 Tax=Sphingomonas sp. LaA6.9 TaxID=2919914 RepID=UPI001F4FF9BF|nr:GNAT family N-acetyltransferase [Sphingomonas sp. LaA6.9]MCJ8159636.1 GNAT family N-acetyltransferase [Sphingomonas sp. LaA6.9]